MGYFSRLANKVFKRFTLQNPPTWFIRGFTDAGVEVRPDTSLAINAVYVSSKIIGETISSFTVESIQRDGEKRTKLNDEVRYLLGVCPDEESGIIAADYWKAVMIHICTHGNSFSYIERNARGRVLSIKLLMPWDVSIYKMDGQLFYKTKSYGILMPDELLHFKGLSWNGTHGLSPVREQSDLMNLSLKISEYGKTVYGKKVPGYISSPNELNAEQIVQVSKVWESQVTGDSLGGTPVLGGDMKYNNIPMTPADIDYIKTNGITDKNIYSMFRIPPTMAQDYERATFSNAEQQDLVFVKYTMLPYLRGIEQEVTHKLYPIANRTTDKPKAFKFNINSIMRADLKTRTEAAATMWERGIISANEWRAREDMNPKEGGNDYFVMVNMQRERDIDKNIDAKTNGRSVEDFELDYLIKGIKVNGESK